MCRVFGNARQILRLDLSRIFAESLRDHLGIVAANLKGNDRSKIAPFPVGSLSCDKSEWVEVVFCFSARIPSK